MTFIFSGQAHGNQAFQAFWDTYLGFISQLKDLSPSLLSARRDSTLFASRPQCCVHGEHSLALFPMPFRTWARASFSGLNPVTLSHHPCLPLSPYPPSFPHSISGLFSPDCTQLLSSRLGCWCCPWKAISANPNVLCASLSSRRWRAYLALASGAYDTPEWVPGLGREASRTGGPGP